MLRESKLHFVDLAGSERIKKSQLDGLVLKEAKSINLSLHYLEQVIGALQVTLVRLAEIGLYSQCQQPEYFFIPFIKYSSFQDFQG